MYLPVFKLYSRIPLKASYHDLRFLIYEETRCVCEKQMPLIMANSNNDQSYKDKYIDNSTKILSSEMLMCIANALILIIL